MHRSEVLTKYSRYLIGTVAGQKPQIVLPTNGTLSPVPYAEPTWLSEGFKSPYYRDSHRSLQKAMREFVDAEVREDAQMHERDGKRPTVELVQKMGSPEMNLNAMVSRLSSVVCNRDSALTRRSLPRLAAHGSEQAPRGSQALWWRQARRIRLLPRDDHLAGARARRRSRCVALLLERFPHPNCH